MKTILQPANPLVKSHLDHPLPANLGALLAPGELIQAALEAVNTFFWSGSAPATPVAAGTYNPRVILTLLTYSYSIGVFASTAIARECERNETFRYLSMGLRFAADRICIFRGQNSELLKRCLALVVRKAAPSAGPAAGAPMTAAGARAQYQFRLLAFSQMEAQRRILWAVQLDQSGES